MTAPGRYAYNPTSVKSNFKVFERGEYEFEFGMPKAFVVKNPDGSVKNYGIRIAVTCAEGKYKGEKSLVTLYMHNEGSQSMTKRFQMGVLGYKNNSAEEDRFDLEQRDVAWDQFDPETGAVGEPWKKFSGGHAIASVDVGIAKEGQNKGEEQQQWKSWRPIEG